MTSACVFKNTLRNDIQVFLNFKTSNFEICLHLIISISTRYFLTSSTRSSNAGASKEIPPNESDLSLPAKPITFCFQYLPFSCSDKRRSIHFKFKKQKWHPICQLNQLTLICFMLNNRPKEASLPRPNTPIVLKSTRMSGNDTQKMISKSSIASPEPHFVIIESDSNEPTILYGFGRPLSYIPPSLNDLNLPPNPFDVLATMAMVNRTEDGQNDIYSPQSLKPTNPSPISTPPMNVSTIDGSETPHTVTDDNTFYYIDEPRRIFFLPPSPSSTPSPPRKTKTKSEIGMSLPKRSGVSQLLCEACGQVIPPAKDIPGPSTTD